MRLLHALWIILFAIIFRTESFAEPCQMQLVGKLPVTVQRGKVLIDGALGGQPVKFILDTGAGISLLDPKAERLSIARHPMNGVHLYGFNGEAPVQELTVRYFQLGSYKVDELHLTALRDDSLGSNIYGLIGLDFLAQFDVELDIADGLVNLFVPGQCPGHQVYWSSAFSEADINFASAIDKHIRLPVILNDRHFTAMLDSGSHATLVDRYSASPLGYSDESNAAIHMGQMHGIDGNVEEVYAYRFDSFSLADEQIAHPLLAVSKISGASTMDIGSLIPRKISDEQMILGLDFIKSHRIFIDFGEGHIYFNYLGGPVFLTPTKSIAQNIAATK